MIYLDLLYPSKEEREKCRSNKTIGDRLVEDLCLQEFVCSDIMGKKEYEQLCNEINYLPVDEKIIRYRQEVLQDFINNPGFIRRLLDICERLQYRPPDKHYGRTPYQVIMHEKLKEYIELVEGNFKLLFETTLSADTELKSEAMTKIAAFMNNPEHRKNAKEIIVLLTAFLDAQAVGYSLKFTYGKLMNLAQIAELGSENVIPLLEERGWRRNKTIDKEHYIDATINWILGNNLNEIYQKTLYKLCDFIQRINNRLLFTFKQILYDSSYYHVAVNLNKFCRKYNIAVCRPNILSAEEEKLEAKELFPIYLALQYHKQNQPDRIKSIQSNNYDNSQGKIAIITGVNSGGKTVFLQSLGLAQLFAQLGFFVPAASYRASAAQYIGSLYAMSEDTGTVHGKLEKELVCIRQTSQQIKKHSLILINEILASTSEEDGTAIAADVIRVFAHTSSNIIFVTHLYDLADMAATGKLTLPEGERAVSLITERLQQHEGGRSVTYHIIPGKPLKDIWEKNLIDKYIAGVNGAM
ncbi:MAG: hypothetical protein GX757_08855 [Clostridiales bacterium]|nr:hypothetical protein [Clostridiales bacterium]